MKDKKQKIKINNIEDLSPEIKIVKIVVIKINNK